MGDRPPDQRDKARIERAPLERQRLLVPELVDCGAGAIERIEALAGVFRIETQPARGFRLDASVPLDGSGRYGEHG